MSGFQQGSLWGPDALAPPGGSRRHPQVVFPATSAPAPTFSPEPSGSVASLEAQDVPAPLLQEGDSCTFSETQAKGQACSTPGRRCDGASDSHALTS